MPSRKIIKSVDIAANNQLIHFLNNQHIRTFFQQDSLNLLSKPSHFISLHMKKNINKEVSRLRKLCAHRNFAYLTDIQCITFLSYFTIHKNPIQDQWTHKTYSNFKDFETYFNPKIMNSSGPQREQKEVCHSFPFLECKVLRYPEVTLSYSKIANIDKINQYPVVQEYQQTFSGFKATLIQHCMDHLYGRHFFTPDLCRGRLTFDSPEKLFEKTKFLIKQYNIRVKNGLQNKPMKESDVETLKKYEKKIQQSYIKQVANAEQYLKQRGPNIME